MIPSFFKPLTKLLLLLFTLSVLIPAFAMKGVHLNAAEKWEMQQLHQHPTMQMSMELEADHCIKNGVSCDDFLCHSIIHTIFSLLSIDYQLSLIQPQYQLTPSIAPSFYTTYPLPMERPPKFYRSTQLTIKT